MQQVDVYVHTRRFYHIKWSAYAIILLLQRYTRRRRRHWPLFLPPPLIPSSVRVTPAAQSTPPPPPPCSSLSRLARWLLLCAGETRHKSLWLLKVNHLIWFLYNKLSVNENRCATFPQAVDERMLCWLEILRANKTAVTLTAHSDARCWRFTWLAAVYDHLIQRPGPTLDFTLKSIDDDLGVLWAATAVTNKSHFKTSIFLGHLLSC